MKNLILFAFFLASFSPFEAYSRETVVPIICIQNHFSIADFAQEKIALYMFIQFRSHSHSQNDVGFRHQTKRESEDEKIVGIVLFGISIGLFVYIVIGVLRTKKKKGS
jgi:uncharacterized membrane protein YbjE (DUF340 family)